MLKQVSYPKKVGKEPTESASKYLFIADKETEGTNQIIMETGYRYDSETDLEYLENICIRHANEGYKNIIVHQIKKYYIKAKKCSVMMPQPQIVAKFIYK